jgi:hypothetical protein
MPHLPILKVLSDAEDEQLNRFHRLNKVRQTESGGTRFHKFETETDWCRLSLDRKNQAGYPPIFCSFDRFKLKFGPKVILLAEWLPLLIQSLSKPIATKLRRLRSIGASG